MEAGPGLKASGLHIFTADECVVEGFPVFASAILRAVFPISNEKMSNQNAINGLMRLHMVRKPLGVLTSAQGETG